MLNYRTRGDFPESLANQCERYESGCPWVELLILRLREQNESSMSPNKKTSRRKFINGREETRTPTPKAPVPKTGASTIPPLVRAFNIPQTSGSVKFISLPRFQKICSTETNTLHQNPPYSAQF